MKILIVRNSPTKMNLHNYNVQEIGLAKALIKKGHQVGIVFYTDEMYHEQVLDNVKIFFIPGKKIINYVIYEKKIYEIANQYDIIQTSEYNQIMSYLLLKKFPEKTLIYHGPYYRKNIVTIINNIVFDCLFLKKYKKMNPYILAKSKLAKEFLKDKGFTKIFIVGVGLDPSKFQRSQTSDTFLTAYNKESFNMISISTIEKRKNTYFLLQVLNNLLKINNNYHLFLIGKPIKKYKKKCLQYIEKNNLQNYVSFIDSISQNKLQSIYERSDVLLLASSYEIFGMVLLEAKYFNVNVVSSYNGGASFLLDKNEIVNTFDVETWCDRILKIKKQKNKIVKSKLTWDDMIDSFIKVYQKIKH